MTSTSTRDLVSQPYKYGFVTEIETDKIAKGLSEEVVRLISAKKEEPDFLLQFRLKAFRHWLTLEEPDWAALGYPRDRLPRHRLLRGSQAAGEEGQPR